MIWWTLAWWFICALVTGGSAGCMRGSTQEASSLPTLGDIRPPPPQDVQVDRLEQGPRRVSVQITDVNLPVDAAVEPVWAKVSELTGAKVDLWHANGLRVGVLDHADLHSFVAALPKRYAVQTRVVTGTAQPSPLPISPPLKDVFRMVTTLSSKQKQTMTFRRGRCQFLLGISSPIAGYTAVDLIPHYHVPKPSVRPISPLKRLLEGRVFDQLALSVSLPRGGLLVVGVYHDAGAAPMGEIEQTNEPTDAQAESKNSAARAPATKPASSLRSPRTRLLPNKLGSLLLGASRGGKPIQIMLLIGARPSREAQKKSVIGDSRRPARCGCE